MPFTSYLAERWAAVLPLAQPRSSTRSRQCLPASRQPGETDRHAHGNAERFHSHRRAFAAVSFGLALLRIGAEADAGGFNRIAKKLDPCLFEDGFDTL